MILINYITEKDKTDDNIYLIEQVFRELEEQDITGIRCAVYKLGENVFIHIVYFRNKEACRAFTALPAVRRFFAGIDGRLEGDPIINEVEEIGSYNGLF